MKSASLACALHRKFDGRSLASALHVKFETPSGLVCKKRIRGQHGGRFRKYSEVRKFFGHDGKQSTADLAWPHGRVTHLQRWL